MVICRSEDFGRCRGKAALRRKVARLLTSTAAVALVLGTPAHAQNATYDPATETLTVLTNVSNTTLNSAGQLVAGANNSGFRDDKAGNLTINVGVGTSITANGIGTPGQAADAVEIRGNSGATAIVINNAGTIQQSNNGTGINSGIQWINDTFPFSFELNNTGIVSGRDAGIFLQRNVLSGVATITNETGGEIIGVGGTNNGEDRGWGIVGESEEDRVINRGLIRGSRWGVELGGGTDTIDNFGTIEGTTDFAISLGEGDDRATLHSGSVTINQVFGGGGEDQLIVQGELRGNLFGNTGNDAITLDGIGNITGDIDGGDDDDTISIQGSATLGGDILAGGGTDTVLIDNTSVYNGGVFGQDGSDTITITSNFDMNHLREIDGGGGTAVIGGDFDELRLQGQNFDAATSTYLPTTFQSIVLQQASELRLHDTQTLTTGRLTTEAGTLFGFDGTANISDGASLGALLNNGFTTSSNGRTGDILNVGGDFTGSGSLFLDAALDATEASDFVVVGGTTTSGDTQSIVINDVGDGIGADTGTGPGNGIKLVDVSATGATQVSDFILAGGPIDVGAFQYDLSLQTDDIWYLQSFAVVDPGVITPGLPLHIKSFGQQTVGTYYERTGTRIGCRTAGIGHQFNRSNADLITTEPVPEPVLEDESCNYGVWARAIGAWSDAQGNITNSGNTIGAYDETLWAIQGGVDGVLAEYETGYLTASGFLQYGQVKADYRNVSLGTDVGSTNADAYGGGGSLTYNDQNGLYLDGVVTYTHYDIDIATTAGDTANTKADAWVFSGELGKRVDVGEQFAITPQGQLTYQLINVDGYTTALGTQANVSNANSLEGRLGATFEYLPHRADSASRLYVEANVVHEFLDAPVTTIGNTALAYDFEDTAYEIGVGYQWGEKGAEGLAMWIEGDYRAPFSGDGIDIWAATAGLAYRF